LQIPDLADAFQWVSPEFHLSTRVHEMKRQYQGARLFIKREDELSSGIAGSKYRKFASLIPFFKQELFHEILLIGSAQSNNIVAALQLLIENGIKSKLMLMESNEQELKGNLLWLSMLHQLEDVIWISRENWHSVQMEAEKYLQDAKLSGRRVFILPEGGAVAEALPGAMTLAADILNNEKEHSVKFEHICIDSGSGTSAIGLMLGLRDSGMKKNIYITLIAGNKADFGIQFQALTSSFTKFSGVDSELPQLDTVHFYKPAIAPSFGSITGGILKETMNIAREEGILMDPVYSVKHLLTVRSLIENGKMSGNILFIYNGGSFGLSGFQSRLSALQQD
jgi:1-aminocyclopropane-1-carboxylate deaminase